MSGAHPRTQQTCGDAAGRFAAKWRLARLLYERNQDRQRTIDPFAIPTYGPGDNGTAA